MVKPKEFDHPHLVYHFTVPSNKDFIFAMMHFRGELLTFIDRSILLARSIAITGVPFLINVADI